MNIRKIDWKEIFSIPNCMSFFRLLLIPIFYIIYIKADSAKEYSAAAAVVLISAITDFLDGKIARKFHMITEFGKFLDPLADKLTHGVIAICLMKRYRYMKYLVLVMALKEGFMAVMGLINLRYGKKLDGAKMYGKICTTTLFLVLSIFVLASELPEIVANTLIIVEIIIMLITWALYIPVFYEMYRSAQKVKMQRKGEETI